MLLAYHDRVRLSAFTVGLAGSVTKYELDENIMQIIYIYIVSVEPLRGSSNMLVTQSLALACKKFICTLSLHRDG